MSATILLQQLNFTCHHYALQYKQFLSLHARRWQSTIWRGLVQRWWQWGSVCLHLWRSARCIPRESALLFSSTQNLPPFHLVSLFEKNRCCQFWSDMLFIGYQMKLNCVMSHEFQLPLNIWEDKTWFPWQRGKGQSLQTKMSQILKWYDICCYCIKNAIYHW